MDQPSACRSDFVVGHFADAVVTEIPPLVGLNAHNVAAPELVESTNERIFLQIACPGENVESEITPNGGCDLGCRSRFIESSANRAATTACTFGSALSPEPGSLTNSIRPRSTMNSG
jgi:hypothetical protein